MVCGLLVKLSKGPDVNQKAVLDGQMEYLFRPYEPFSVLPFPPSRHPVWLSFQGP